MFVTNSAALRISFWQPCHNISKCLILTTVLILVHFCTLFKKLSPLFRLTSFRPLLIVCLAVWRNWLIAPVPMWKFSIFFHFLVQLSISLCYFNQLCPLLKSLLKCILHTYFSTTLYLTTFSEFSWPMKYEKITNKVNEKWIKSTR